MTEAIQKISDPPLTSCGDCKGQLHKLISMSTFHLKGSGWYVTDYAGKNQSTSAKSSDTAGSESTDKKTEKTKSDSD